MTNSATEQFARAVEREWRLEDLFDGMERARLTELLARQLGPFRLVSASGTVVASRGHPRGELRTALGSVLEPIGVIESDTTEHAAVCVAEHIELLAHAAKRYRTAADLHLCSITASYEELQKKHALLEQSEAELRELSRELEDRVDRQVKMIEAAHRQLYQSEKLASVGQLAAGLAHEINNPIGFVRSNRSMAQEYVGELQTQLEKTAEPTDPDGCHPEAPECRHILDDFSELLCESIQGIERVARIVRDLKDFSGIDRGEFDTIDISQLIDSVRNVISPTTPGHVHLATNLRPVPRLHCRPSHLAQALHNIVRNAIQAISTETGTVTIETRTEQNTVRIDIHDDGCGILPQIRGRVFEPFFTTREVGTGTGLGLTVARDIVVAHGGTIEISSNSKNGSTVTIRLPIDEAAGRE